MAARESPVLNLNDLLGVSLRARSANDSGIREHEVVWTSSSAFLEQKGYRLRSRYQWSWTPSYGRVLEVPESTEDSIILPQVQTPYQQA